MSAVNISEREVEEAALAFFEIEDVPQRDGVTLDEAGLAPKRSIIPSVLREAVLKLNLDIAPDHDAVEQIIRATRLPPHPALVENNRWFHGLLTDGVPVEYKD